MCVHVSRVMHRVIVEAQKYTNIHRMSRVVYVGSDAEICLHSSAQLSAEIKINSPALSPASLEQAYTGGWG